MREIKDTKQAKVRIGYDGKVHKHFRGPVAEKRYKNEIFILKFLEQQGCLFVPRVLDSDDASLYMVTTNCGAIVDKISQEKMESLFSELESYGVKHEDPFPRNVTYSAQLGRFCIIDFEFARIISTGEGLDLKEPGLKL